MKYTKPGITKDEFRPEIFSEFVDIEFEGLKLKAIKDYDEYLKLVYGDYMKLPPESKRVGHEYRAFRV
jgi:lipopolysaccharide cholinephosphotransferase